MLNKGGHRQRLGHDVGYHLRRWDVLDSQVALLDLLADKVLCEAEVAGPIAEMWVARESVGTLIVPKQHHRAFLALRKLSEELRQMDCLL